MAKNVNFFPLNKSRKGIVVVAGIVSPAVYSRIEYGNWARPLSLLLLLLSTASLI